MILTRDKVLELIKSGKLKIEPFDERLVRENGIDLRISDEYATMTIGNVRYNPRDALYLDKDDPKDFFVVKHAKDYIVVPPRGFILACTIERIELPENVVGLCNLRSTLARWGLAIPPTVVDAGFKGQLTIEIFNNTPHEIHIPVGAPFLHLVLIRTDGEAKYEGTYQNQKGVTLPKRITPIL